MECSTFSCSFINIQISKIIKKKVIFYNWGNNRITSREDAQAQRSSVDTRFQMWYILHMVLYRGHWMFRFFTLSYQGVRVSCDLLKWLQVESPLGSVYGRAQESAPFQLLKDEWTLHFSVYIFLPRRQTELYSFWVFFNL